MKAITTVFKPATNRHGSRIEAKDMDGNHACFVAPDNYNNTEDMHHRAADVLIAKKNWTGRIIGGQQNPTTYVWVFLAPNLGRPIV